jgi:hypothetical protein
LVTNFLTEGKTLFLILGFSAIMMKNDSEIKIVSCPVLAKIIFDDVILLPVPVRIMCPQPFTIFTNAMFRILDGNSLHNEEDRLDCSECGLRENLINDGVT